MATKTWINAAGGSWVTGANWAGGVAPVAGDDVVLGPAGLIGGYAVSLPAASYSLNSLTLAARGTIVTLNGSTLATVTASVASGTFKGGTLSGGISAGAAAGSIDIATLDGVTVRGAVHVGTPAQSQELVVQNGITVANADGTPGTIELSGTAVGQRTTLFFQGAQTWSRLNILMDAGSSDVLQGRTLGPALTLAADTTLTVNGLGSVVSTNIGGRIVVGSTGLLVIGDGLQAAPSSVLPTARISIASGGLLRVTSDITSAALTALAGQVEGPVGTISANPAFNGSNSAIITTGSAVDYTGRITNTGATLDLTAGGPLAHISRFGNSAIAGGTLRNTGPAVAMPFGTLTGVTLQGQFSMDPNLGGVLIVHDGIGAVGLDGSNGTLDLASVPTSLRVDAPTTPGATALIDHVTIRTGDLNGGQYSVVGQDSIINGAAPVLLGSFTVVNMTASGSIAGTVTSAGVINLSGPGATGPHSLSVGAPAYKAAYGPEVLGSFENDGTINLGAGDQLTARGTFSNKGLVNIGAGASVSVTAGATGQYAFTGIGGALSFAAGAKDVVSVSGYRAGDTIAIGAAASGASLSVAGNVVTVAKGGVALAALTLSDAGQPYDANSLQLSAAADGTIAITTTHGTVPTLPVVTEPTIPVPPTVPATPVVTTPVTPIVTTPVTPTTPIVTTPTAPVTPVDTRPQIAFSNATQNMGGTVRADAVAAGGPSYLQWQYIDTGSDSIAYSAATPNMFIHSGSGNDSIQVASGQNVLDGGLGSNFLTGGSGTDTFFTDARNPGVVWNTIRNFHAGDAATLWGFTPGVSSYRWEAGVAGAEGSQGATLRANIVGGAGRTGDGIDASITFSGISVEQARGLKIVTGVQAAGSYLFVYNPGV